MTNNILKPDTGMAVKTQKHQKETIFIKIVDQELGIP